MFLFPSKSFALFIHTYIYVCVCVCVCVYIYLYLFPHLYILKPMYLCQYKQFQPNDFFLFFLFVAYLAGSIITNVFTALGFLRLVLVCHCWLFSKDALVNLPGFSPLPGPKELPIPFLDVWLVLSQLKTFSSVQFSHSVMSESLLPQGVMHARLPNTTSWSCQNLRIKY